MTGALILPIDTNARLPLAGCALSVECLALWGAQPPWPRRYAYDGSPGMGLRSPTPFQVLRYPIQPAGGRSNNAARLGIALVGGGYAS